MNKELELKLIRIDCGTQSRAEISQSVIDEYETAMIDGSIFPPVTVFHDGVDYYLADGFHRYFATKSLGNPTITVDLHTGTLRDARLHSFSVNSMHGQRRTNADKRKAVLAMLDDFEWSGWSNLEIARRCHVSATLVASLREETDNKDRKYVTPTGIVATKKVANVKPKAAEPVSKATPAAPSEDVEQPLDSIDPAMMDELVMENERLNERVALAAMDATEEEKQAAEVLIAELREEIKMLNIEVKSLRISRDQFQAENAQLKKQVAAQQRQLKKLEA